jgi:hypothetical protein
MQQTIAIKRFRFDPKNMKIGWSIVRVRTIHTFYRCSIYKTHSVVSQTLELANDKWSLLNHPNIKPIWLLRSSTSAETILAFAMPWFDNGNVLDFAYRRPHINKLNIVRLELPWFCSCSEVNQTRYKCNV